MYHSTVSGILTHLGNDVAGASGDLKTRQDSSRLYPRAYLQCLNIYIWITKKTIDDPLSVSTDVEPLRNYYCGFCISCNTRVDQKNILMNLREQMLLESLGYERTDSALLHCHTQLYAILMISRQCQHQYRYLVDSMYTLTSLCVVERRRLIRYRCYGWYWSGCMICACVHCDYLSTRMMLRIVVACYVMLCYAMLCSPNID